MSKTFRDAIDIARALNFSWVWIDLLCIIQDNTDDWNKESSLMASVYGSSSLNIAATAALDGTTGCLFKRDLVYVRGGHIEVEINDEDRTYDYFDSDLFLNDIDAAPLLGRAWVVQERLLAPRTLHFAVSQVFWECKAKFACETFPDQVPALFLFHDSYLPIQELWKQWNTIV